MKVGQKNTQLDQLSTGKRYGMAFSGYKQKFLKNDFF